MTPIPRSEFDRLLHDIERAVGCATLGGRVTGHEILQEGLRRAEYARLQGEEWANPLIARYRQAIREYLDFYGMRLD
jgi:hypothetical protein